MALVAVGSREAAQVYALGRPLAAADLSSWRGRDHAARTDGVDAYLRLPLDTPRVQPTWQAFVALEANGLRRWATIARAWRPSSSPSEAAERLLRLIVERDAEIAARRTAHVTVAAASRGLNQGLLFGFAMLVVLAGLALRSVVRRRQILADAFSDEPTD
jgi:hypothetical protein